MYRRILAVALLLAGFWCLGQQEGRSQFIGDGVWKAEAAAGGFQGPGDIVASASLYWSCTVAYTAAYASGANNACDLIRASDSATCTAKFASSGIVDTTVGVPCAGATVTSFCNATVCSITQLYDQTGNANHGAQVTLSRDPVFTFNGIGTCPTATYTSGADSGLRNLSFTLATPWTDVFIVRSTSASGPGDLGAAASLTLNTSANTIQLVASGANISTGISQNTLYAAQGTQPAAGTASLDINGSTATGTTANTAIGAAQIGRAFDGDVPLMGIWPVAFNGTQLANMNTLLRAKCGGF